MDGEKKKRSSVYPANNQTKNSAVTVAIISKQVDSLRRSVFLCSCFSISLAHLDFQASTPPPLYSLSTFDASMCFILHETD
jgi:hypothetical protein